MTTDINKLIISSPTIRQGKPRISGTGITVHRIAIWYKSGYSAEEITCQYPHLTLAQVYAALAYYHANQAVIDGEIAAEEEGAKRLETEYLQTQKVLL
jgi:uncharacterized protein (DUF433 family)